MCMGKPKMPNPKPTPPPPMYVPTEIDDNVRRKGFRERARAASLYGRESTVGASGSGASGPPVTSGKTLLGM